jgi:diguanylate cyclase (GGDEF)-like protein
VTWAVLAGDTTGGSVDLRHWHTDTQPILDLDTGWQFVADRWLAPDAVNTAPGDAQTVAVPHTWATNGASPRIGSYWIDLRLSDMQRPLSLWLERVCGAAQLYWIPPGSESTPLRTARRGTPARAALNERPDPAQLLLPLTGLEAGTYRLLIHVSSHHDTHGGLCGAVAIGDSEALNTLALRHTTLTAGQIAVMLTVAAFALALYAQKRSERAALWLGTSCFALAVFHFIGNGLWDFLIGNQAWRYALRHQLYYIAACWVPAALLMFYHHSFEWPHSRRLAMGNLALTIALSLLIALAAPDQLERWLPALTAVWLVQTGAALTLLSRAAWRRLPQARGMLLAVAPLAVAVPVSLYIAGERPGLAWHRGTSSAVLFFLTVQAYLTSARFVRAFHLAESMSSRLARKIAERTRALREQNQALEGARQQLTAANASLRRLSITDGLTQVHNRLYFEQEYLQEWRRCARQSAPLSVLMVDADHFKQLNDSAGHLVGDRCLQAIAATLHQHFRRARELVARYGGEEFVIMLPDTGLAQALAIAEGLRTAIAQTCVEHAGHRYQVTVSIGVASSVPQIHARPDQLLEIADAALYRAKAEGRNRIAGAPDQTRDNAARYTAPPV